MYQDEAGDWWLDGTMANFLGSSLPPVAAYTGAPMVDCWVTIEYLNASNVVVGTDFVPVLAYVLEQYGGRYYAYYHAPLDPPPGAVVSKTRPADSSGPGMPNSGIVDTGASAVRLVPAYGAPTVGAGGRTTFQMSVTNTSGYNLSWLMFVGQENYNVGPGDDRFLDTLYADGPDYLAAGETSGPYIVRGLAATPVPYARSGLQAWVEAELMPDATVWRFFNKKTGTHFYTASEDERDNVIATLSSTYNLEGQAYTVQQKLPDNRTVLWRFYNKRSGTHFYTASAVERDNVIATLAHVYNLEGPAYYVSAVSGSEPGVTTVWRMYNKVTQTHFYTASTVERDNVLATMPGVYNLEGPAWFIDK